MTYKQMKWLILIIPTLTIGLWEYVRHEFLLPYISMELGNILAPFIVFFVTILFLTQLFAMIERHQEEWNRAKALQAVFEEREKIARELHDGIAQSLFLLNAQVERMGRAEAEEGREAYVKVKETLNRTNAYVREAIASIRNRADPEVVPWMQGIQSLIEEIRRETNFRFQLDWKIPEDKMSAKEKVQLLGTIREALLNVYKHAEASEVRIEGRWNGGGWTCTVSDDGKGFDVAAPRGQDQYGMKIMAERARQMDWRFDIARMDGYTIVSIRKEGDSHE
ncbi:histidine kinase [Paenibacillus sp. TRM 82003]|nr:histidine kinase [Paenibacillus sp. TRM 82003]